MKDTTTVIEHDGHASSPSPGLFSIDPGLSIWTWVVFAILFIILRKFAWKPMMDSVEKREKMISDAVDQAEKTKEELAKIAKTQQEILQKASVEAQKIIDSGKVSAEKIAQSIQDKALADAKLTLDRASEQIEGEKKRVLREIREQSVDLVVAATEKLIGETLNDERHTRIVKKHLEEM